MHQTFKNDTEWETYREKLRRIIEDPAYGIVLDADIFYTSEGPIQEEGWAFELTSGNFKKKFLTLWQLFDHRNEFQECIRMLARKALEMCARYSFGAVVTCTTTARHLMELIHSRIETREEKIQTHYLGIYPFPSIEHAGLLDLQDQRVLILTDVVSSGAMVSQMIRTVEELKGEVVGVLTVLVTGQKYIGRKFFPVGERNIPFEYLTDYSIPELQAGEFDLTRVRKIDPATVLPEEMLSLPQAFHPLFTDQEMFRHFERANAVEFDFFQFEDRHFMTAVSVDRLLKKCGDSIWRRVRPLFPQGEDFAIVTTHEQGDMVYKAFIEDRLAQSDSYPPFVMVASREIDNGPYRYFLLNPNAQDLNNKKHIILLITSAHTSEKLRELVSLLAVTSSVEKITVVCLLNRMGLQTLNFVSRITKLLHGLGKPEEETVFEFKAVYNLADMPRNDILRMQQTIEILLSHYADEVHVPSLQRCVNQDRPYFRARPITTFDFLNPEPDQNLLEPYQLPLNENLVRVTKEKAKLILLCNYLVATRDYQPILKELRECDNKGLLYRYFAILLGDIGFLRITRKFGDLRSILITRICTLQQERLKQESVIHSRRSHRFTWEMLRRAQLNPDLLTPEEMDNWDHIKKGIEHESNLAFGLSLFAFLDQGYDYPRFIEERITAGLSQKEWRKYPINFYEQFVSERWLLTTSMLLHFCRQRHREGGKVSPSNQRFLTLVRGHINSIDKLLREEVEPGTDPRVKDDQMFVLNEVKAGLDDLMTELGDYTYKEKHHTIRFLHSTILEPRLNHNPIFNNLRRAVEQLEVDHDIALTRANLAETLGPAADPTVARDVYIAHPRIPLASTDLPRKLDEGIFAAKVLEAVAEALRHLFSFASSPGADARHLLASVNEEGFTKDVRLLANMLERIRRDHAVSQGELQKLRDLWRTIREELTEKELIRSTLQRYVAPLRRILYEMMGEASQEIKVKTTLAKEANRLKKESRTLETYVLLDETLLQEVLKNLCTNVRYQAKGQHGKRQEIEVKCECETFVIPTTVTDMLAGGAEERLEYIRLRLTSSGKPYNPAGQREGRVTTFEQHSKRIAEYGGRLELRSADDKSGAVAELILISRTNKGDKKDESARVGQ